jgi:DNA-binding response OmpR family regulator
MSEILLVGNDFRLLTTRAAVLAQTKAKVVCCNALEVMQVLQDKSFDLVILCHSLTGKQTSEITAIVRQKMPRTKILMIIFDTSEGGPPKGVALDAVISADPRGLVRRTSEILRQQSIQSTEKLPETDLNRLKPRSRAPSEVYFHN